MKKNKFIAVLLLSFLSVTFSINTFAYNPNVEKKLTRIDDDIKKIQEKISKKNSNNRYNKSSGSSSNRTQKLKDKITDLEDEKKDIIKKENNRIEKAVKSVENRKKQSTNKIQNLEKTIAKKKDAANKKYENDKKKALALDPKAKVQPFKFSAPSEEKMIKAEKDRLKQYDVQIQKIKNPQSKMSRKK